MKLTAIAAALLAAAEGQDGVGPLTIAGIVGALIAVFVIRAYLFPYRTCPRCDGSSRRPGSTGRAFGICGKCGGEGVTLRPAARFFRSHRDD